MSFSFACYELRVSISPSKIRHPKPPFQINPLQIKSPPSAAGSSPPPANHQRPTRDSPETHQRPTRDPPFHNAPTNGTPHQITPQSPSQKQPFAISKKLRNFALESVIQQIQQINMIVFQIKYHYSSILPRWRTKGLWFVCHGQE